MGFYPPILPITDWSKASRCEWTDELPGEPCGDDTDNTPPATHYFEVEQSDGNDFELEKRWVERWNICTEHAEFLGGLSVTEQIRLCQEHLPSASSVPKGTKATLVRPEECEACNDR